MHKSSKDKFHMLPQKLIFVLDDGYTIKTESRETFFEISLFKNGKQIGNASLVTDSVDVGCITHIQIDDAHVNHIFSNQHTLGEAIFKFLIKFPSFIRRLEFSFILNVPKNLQILVDKFHFNNYQISFENGMMLRANNLLPDKSKLTKSIIFKQEVGHSDLQKLFFLIKENAYWQSHLTLERLTLLVNNSIFMLACDDDDIVGCARILSDGSTFASLWDVVVKKSHQGQGIGTALMYAIFSNPKFNSIENWIIFTDTAKSLYEKFGFAAAKEIPEKNLVYKLRTQTSHPSYMAELFQIIQQGLPVYLDMKQSFNFLFSEQGKRCQLSHFWKSIPPLSHEEEEYFISQSTIKKMT